MRPPTFFPSKLGRALAVAALALGVFATPAIAGIAPEEANSANAESIRTAYWVMLIVVVVIGLVLLGALLAAFRRFRDGGAPERPRQLTAGRGVAAKATAGLSVVAAAIFVFGVAMTGGARSVEADENAEAIDIRAVGMQWLWRYEYPVQESGASPGIATVFSYQDLVVPVDTTVNIDLTSVDVLHRWFVPALGGQLTAVPGETSEMSFRAEEEGVFEGRSTEFSGTSYPAMRTRVRVVSQAAYDQYLEDLEADLAAGRQAVASEAPAAEEDQGA